MLTTAVLALALAGAATAAVTPSPVELVDDYLQRYFATYPSRATAAGRHDHDRELEDLSPAALSAWIGFNRELRKEITAALARDTVPLEDRLDLEVLDRQAAQEVWALESLDRPHTDPLMWTGIAAEAAPFLLVREDLPLPDRLARTAARARFLPRLAAQAEAALGGTDPARLAPELCTLAVAQARATATFYREGLPAAAVGQPEALRAEVEATAHGASYALERLADFLEARAAQATGSPRLGDRYAETLRLATGLDLTPDALLERAESALGAKRREAATFGRRVWGRVLPAEDPPGDDAALLRRLFDRVGDDHADSEVELVADFRQLADRALAFVRRLQLLEVPEGFSLIIDRSPSYFIGQSVGGVYPAGPWEPNAPTLLFLPTPPDSATPEQQATLFRGFNHHFDVMITPHELIPGHAFQLASAARHPRKVRSIFPDGVYVEGWGTFCERLMLDLGWDGETPANRGRGAASPDQPHRSLPWILARLAHLKKQLENIARAIVDVRVHTRGMTRDDLLRFVQNDALQDAQFASNMWVRSITTAPQLTTYFLGYEQVRELYRKVRDSRGEAFDLPTFLDGMMELGPVPVIHYRRRMLGFSGSTADRPSSFSGGQWSSTRTTSNSSGLARR
jgi:uncharacterized protein (DUF885 family)